MRVVVLLCIFVITGCATVGPKFSGMPDVSDKALVYVYRPDKFQNGGISPGFIVDGEERLLIKNNGYTYFYLSPGDHNFSLLLSERYSNIQPMQLTMLPGKVYYLRVFTSAEVKVQFIAFSVFGYSANRQFSIGYVENSVGEAEVTECVYLDPSKSKKFSKSIFMED